MIKKVFPFVLTIISGLPLVIKSNNVKLVANDNFYFESFLGNQNYFSDLSLDYDILINQRKRVTVSFTINEPSLDFDAFINYYKYLSLPENSVIGKLYFKWDISPTYYELNLDKFFHLSTGFAVPDNTDNGDITFFLDMFQDAETGDKINLKYDFVISQSVIFTMTHARALIFTDNLYLYSQDNGFSYSDAYSKGFEDGENFGYLDGYEVGLQEGELIGIGKGWENSITASTFIGDIIFSTVGAVASFILTLGTFEFMGISLLTLISFVILFGVVLIVIKVIK